MELLIAFGIIFYLETKEPIPMGKFELFTILAASFASFPALLFALGFIGLGTFAIYLSAPISFLAIPYVLFTKWQAREKHQALKYTGILLAAMAVTFIRSMIMG